MGGLDRSLSLAANRGADEAVVHAVERLPMGADGAVLMAADGATVTPAAQPASAGAAAVAGGPHQGRNSGRAPCINGQQRRPNPKKMRICDGCGVCGLSGGVALGVAAAVVTAGVAVRMVVSGGSGSGGSGDACVAWTWLVGGGGCGSCGPTGVECGCVCVCVWWVCGECVECVECECPNMSI
eukprot:COSAG01_NODE_3895_length_5574_cov_17.445297_3_plen_183_part_00